MSEQKDASYWMWVNVASSGLMLLAGLFFWYLFARTSVPYFLFFTGWFMRAAWVKRSDKGAK